MSLFGWFKKPKKAGSPPNAFALAPEWAWCEVKVETFAMLPFKSLAQERAEGEGPDLSAIADRFLSRMETAASATR